MKTLRLLLLLTLVSADRLRYHLKHLIDRNISACDDFFHHACSQRVDSNQFFHARMSNIFQEATAKLLPDAIKNSPIEYDLRQARGFEYNTEDNDYEKLARARCKKDISCYAADQQYYASTIERINGQLLRIIGTTLGDMKPKRTTINSGDKQKAIIANYISDTSFMIDQLTEFLKRNVNLYNQIDGGLNFNSFLQTRLAMIEFMKTNSTYSDFHEVEQISLLMKIGMVENIEKSAWLHGDEISEFIGQKIKEIITSIEVLHDFDNIERNGSTLLKVNRDMNQIYFTEKRNTGISGLDTVLGLSNAFAKLMDTAEADVQFLVHRIFLNFAENAFFGVHGQMKAVTILAPYMYRPLHDSEIIKEPIIMYSTIGHELYHSLFNRDSPLLVDLYNHRGECVMNHYQTACKFALGECSSGKHTFSEDGADLEGFRLTHSMFKKLYSEKQLSKMIDGLETTLEQAFFYYAASEFCSETIARPADIEADVHSIDNVRVNALFSLMPEFSRAFQCKKGDRMFIEEDQSCYIFGPKSKR